MFKKALMTQARVIGALILRETRVRYGRSQFGYLWALIEPAGYVAALSLVFSFMRAGAPFGNSMPLFFALGILPFTLYRNLGAQLGSAFDANEALLSFPIVRELDTVISRAILEISTSLVVITFILSSIVFLSDAPPPSSPLKMLMAIGGLSMFAAGVGLINAVLISKFKSWQNIFQLLNAPMLFISGVFYSMDSMPTQIQKLISWNPVIHGVEGLRDGYFLNYRASAVDLNYLVWCGLITILIGLAAERAIRIRPS